MKIYRGTAQAADFGPAALTIGNFDGLHCGHRRILRRTCELAAEKGLKASVLTFDPHPTQVVAPERAPRLMTTPDERCRLMEAEGIQQVLILPFTPEVARLSPEEFTRSLLVERLGVRAVVVGDNFRFGHRQAGDVEVLRDLGSRYGFQVEALAALWCRGRKVSSSTVRELVMTGQVGMAARLQERPFPLEGEVVPGHGVGRRQTVPTLNLSTRCDVIPATGVYVTRTRDLEDGRGWDSVTNIGYRPTFGDATEMTIETFLLGGLEGAAPRRIRVEFLRRLRAEKKFATADDLKAQIARDVARAQTWFRRVSAWIAGPDLGGCRRNRCVIP